MKSFTNEELRQIESSEYRVRIEALKLEILKLKFQNQQLKVKNSELVTSLKQYELKETSEKVENLKKGHKEFMNGLRSKYGVISDKWGYDPISGEIIEQ